MVKESAWRAFSGGAPANVACAIRKLGQYKLLTKNALSVIVTKIK